VIRRPSEGSRRPEDAVGGERRAGKDSREIVDEGDGKVIDQHLVDEGGPASGSAAEEKQWESRRRRIPVSPLLRDLKHHVEWSGRDAE
jgi:hypothetical protein